MTIDQARRTLNRAVDGENVSRWAIERALRVTGDIGCTFGAKPPVTLCERPLTSPTRPDARFPA